MGIWQRTWVRRTIWTFGGLAVVLLLLAIAAVIYVRTDSGNQAFADLLEDVLSDPEAGALVVIDGLEGNPLDQFTITRFSMTQDGEPFVVAQNVDVVWHPWALLGMTAHVEKFSAGTIDLYDSPPVPDDVSEASDLIPSIPVDLEFESVTARVLRFNGQEPDFALKGALSWSRNEAMDVDIDLSAAGDQDEGIRLQMAFDPSSEQLTVDGSIRTRQSGPLGQFLLSGAPGDLKLIVSGKGALSSWKGSIKGALDGQNVADLALTLGGTGKDQRLGIDGALNPGFLITDAAVDQVVGTLNLDVDVAMRKGLPQSYVAVIGAPAAAITLSGGLRTDADLMAARFNITSRDAGALSPLLGEWSVGSFTLEGQLPGAEADKTQIRFSIRDASGPGVTGLNLGGEAALETRDGGKAKAPTLHIEGAGTVGLLSPAPLDGAWAVTARYEADQVVLERLSISDAQTQLVVGGEVALSPLDVALEVDAKVADLTQWRSLSGLDLTGAMHAKGPVAWRESDVLPRVNLTLVAKNTGFGDDGINEILGASQSLHLITKAASGENGPETDVDIQFSGGILVFDLGGRVDSGTETIAADFNAHLQNPGTVSVLAGMGLSDNVTLSGTLTGAMENPSLVAQINVPQIAQGPITLDDLALNVTADNLGTVPAGRVALKTRLGDADVLGNLTFAVTDNGGWRLDNILLEGDVLNLSGSISAADSGAPAVGALQMTLPRGNLLSALTGTSVMASISGNVELLADGNDQQISVSLDAENLQYSPADQPRTTARTAAIEGLITLKNQVELNRFEMRASDIRSADASVATLSFLATPEGEGLDLKISADGRFEGPFDLALAATLQQAALSAPNVLTLTNLDGTIAERALRLQAPAILTLGEDGAVALSPFRLAYNGGTFETSADYGPSARRVMLSAKDVDLALLALLAGEQNIFGSLNLDAEIDLGGDLGGQPQGQISMQIANLLMGDELQQDPIGLTLESTFSEGMLDAKVSLQTAARLALDAVGRVAFSVGTEPFSVDVDMAAPVSLKVTGAAELEDIWPLTGQYDHILGGNAAVDMALSGSIEQPLLQGTFAIDKASYRNLTTGFRMEAPRLGFSLADGLLKLDPVVATDGGKGTINLSGWVKPFSPDGIEADLKGALAQVKLVRRRATTVTASGDLHYTQDGDAAAVNVNVTIDDAEISLTEQLPSSVVPLEVTELNRPDGLIALPEPPTAQGAAPTITAKVAAANKLFVRGRGLESEWKGNLALAGDLDAPELTGNLELIRGDFQFAGKRFDFDKGLITFSGGTDIDPLIDATAIYEVETLRAQINLSGPVSNPVLSLSSSPELPEEEILSRIMFGTESERLSPIQAAQLAAAAASMSGGGGGFDVVGKIRKALSLERLEIGTTTGENGTSPLIRGGKYLTDNIYVEVGTARDDGEGNSASVDVELTKNITVGTEATTQGNQKLRLRWKWDY